MKRYRSSNNRIHCRVQKAKSPGTADALTPGLRVSQLTVCTAAVVSVQTIADSLLGSPQTQAGTGIMSLCHKLGSR